MFSSVVPLNMANSKGRIMVNQQIMVSRVRPMVSKVRLMASSVVHLQMVDVGGANPTFFVVNHVEGSTMQISVLSF